jgi:hypothetical protein
VGSPEDLEQSLSRCGKEFFDYSIVLPLMGHASFNFLD